MDTPPHSRMFTERESSRKKLCEVADSAANSRTHTRVFYVIVACPSAYGAPCVSKHGFNSLSIIPFPFSYVYSESDLVVAEG